MNFFGMGMQELLVILLICLLVFGASRLPEIGRAFGKTVNEFKRGMKDGLVEEAEIKETADSGKS
jgi:sec-independent protein translocase protein TatA